MSIVRRLRPTTRYVLIAYVLALLVAMASPFVAPRTFEQICSAGGVKMLVKNADGTVEQQGAVLECPMCMPAGAPPPVHLLEVESAPPLGHVLKSIPAARLAAVVAAPLPPRGPPARA